MNYTLQDLTSVLLAFLVDPLFYLVPGLAIASLTNLFDWQQRSLSCRLAIGVCLSVTLMPLLVYYSAKAHIPTIAWYFVSLAMLAYLLVKCKAELPSLFVRLKNELSAHRAIVITALIWTIICPLMIQEIQIGERLYNSVVIYDWSRNAAIGDAIRAVGVPPDCFYYSNVEPSKLFYYYFNILYQVMAQSATNWASPNNSMPPMIAGDIWTGYTIIALVVFAARLLYADADKRLLRNAVLLLWLCGIHLIGWHIICLMCHTDLGTYQWFIDQEILGFFEAAIWIPQHIIGLTAACMSSLILWAHTKGDPSKVKLLLAAIGFANAAGVSAYVAIPFAMFWIFWAAFLLLRKHFKLMFAAAITGGAGAVLLSPFALELQSFHRPRLLAFGPPLVHWNIHENLLELLRVPAPLHAIVTLLVLVPMRLVLWLGPFVLASICYWGRKLYTRADLCCLPLAVSSFLASTFMHSAVQEVFNDDMGWRSIIPMQFVLLLWTARYISLPDFAKYRYAAKLIVFLMALSLLGTMAEFYALRHYTMSSKAVSVLDPERVYYCRAINDQLNRVLPVNARVQASVAPDFMIHPIFSLLYSHRQQLSVDKQRSITFGGNAETYDQVGSSLPAVFIEGTQDSVEHLYRAFKLDALVIGDRDPVWSLKESWLMRQQPAFENRHYKAYLLKNLFDANADRK